MPDARVPGAIDHWAPRFVAMGVDWVERAPLVLLVPGSTRPRRLDRIVPWAQTQRAARETPHDSFVLDEQGSHVCSNVPYRYRPLVADWMAEQLAAAG
jgi:hypothetical protein